MSRDTLSLQVRGRWYKTRDTATGCAAEASISATTLCCFTNRSWYL